jgi:23S rRNA (guanosine2251-2'-O)-methyltransferase
VSGELLFGRNAVLEALRAERPIRRVLIVGAARGDSLREIVETARARSIPVQSTDRQRLDALASHHQGVVAEAALFRYASLEAIVAAAQRQDGAGLVLVLDTLQDPQNFGSLLRTAAAVGAHGAIIPRHRAVGVTPSVVKASAGAVERLPIAQVGNLVRAIEVLKTAGIWVVGLDHRATSEYTETDLSGSVAVVVGGEGHGLRPLVRQACDLLIRLPMPGAIESLNAAVAGSIVLYEALRQRSTRK